MSGYPLLFVFLFLLCCSCQLQLKQVGYTEVESATPWTSDGDFHFYVGSSLLNENHRLSHEFRQVEQPVYCECEGNKHCSGEPFCHRCHWRVHEQR